MKREGKKTMKKLLALAMIIAVLFQLTTALAVSTPIRVACVGDSITSGYGGTVPYPTVLQQLLGSSYEVRNYGIISTTMLKKGDNPYWNQQSFTDSQNWLPDIVIIMLGTNDSKPYNWINKSDFVPDYKDMISRYKALSSQPTVYVNTCATVYNGGNWGITNEVVTGEIVPLVKQAASETGCKVIDINTATQGMPQNFPDNIHPNDAGYAIIANTVYQGIMGGTPTPTPTATPTPVVTNTPTSTPTTTPTPTPSTATATPTPTPSTATPTPTPSTATPTPTPSTATPTPTPSTATPTPTPSTATPTPTPTAGTPVPGGIKVQFFNGNTAVSTNTLYTNFKVVNTGTASVNLSDVKVRYYFTNDGTQADSFACDYSTVGSGNITSSFATIAKTNADRYLEVGFTSSAGTLGAGAGAEIKGRVWKSDWSNFTQTNDYSFNSTATNYVDSTTVTAYLAGALKWGIEP